MHLAPVIKMTRHIYRTEAAAAAHSGSAIRRFGVFILAWTLNHVVKQSLMPNPH